MGSSGSFSVLSLQFLASVVRCTPHVDRKKCRFFDSLRYPTHPNDEDLSLGTPVRFGRSE